MNTYKIVHMLFKIKCLFLAFLLIPCSLHAMEYIGGGDGDGDGDGGDGTEYPGMGDSDGDGEPEDPWWEEQEWDDEEYYEYQQYYENLSDDLSDNPFGDLDDEDRKSVV